MTQDLTGTTPWPTQVDSGVIFPSSSGDGKLFLRTDLDALFEYDLAAAVWKPLGANIDQTIRALNPDSYWKFDELTGNFADSGFGVLTGTYVSGTRARKGYRGSLAVDVQVDTALATMGDNYRFINRAPFTVLAIHNPTASSSGNSQDIVTKLNSGATAGWVLGYGSTGPPFFSRTGGVAVIGDNATHLNEWHLLAGTYDGTNIAFYCNSIYKSGGVDTANIVGATDPLRINGRVGDVAGKGAKGRYDTVAIWSRGLSQAELDTVWSVM